MPPWRCCPCGGLDFVLSRTHDGDCHSLDHDTKAQPLPCLLV